MTEEKLHQIISGKTRKPSKSERNNPNHIHKITSFSAPISNGKKTFRKAVRCEYTVDKNVYTIVFLATGDSIAGKIENIKVIPTETIKTTFKSRKSFNNFIDKCLKTLTKTFYQVKVKIVLQLAIQGDILYMKSIIGGKCSGNKNSKRHRKGSTRY